MPDALIPKNATLAVRYRHLRNEDARRKMEKIDFAGGEGPEAPSAGTE
jgi:hypothetical protein